MRPSTPSDADTSLAGTRGSTQILVPGPHFRPTFRERPVGRSPVLLVLTATITPAPGLVRRSDPATRMQDYLNSLSFHLSLPSALIDRVLFIDNSGSDITPLVVTAKRQPHDKLVELISFSGNDDALANGKACGEFRLLDYGLSRTSLLSEGDRFWKLTGRLRCLNFDDVVATSPADYDILCDLCDFQRGRLGCPRYSPWMDLRLFSCSRKAYDLLFRGKSQSLGPGLTAAYLYDIVLAARSTLAVRPRFSPQPQIVGFSGRSNADYDAPSRRVTRNLRRILRRFAPSLWV